jgi:D-amino-acid dehydrogenase
MSTAILGAGPIGLSIAYELSLRGEEVCVISPIDKSGEAGHVNAGWVSPILAAPVPNPAVIGNAIAWTFDRKSPLKISPSLNPSHVSFMTRMLMNSRESTFVRGLHATFELGRGSLKAFDEYKSAGIDFEIHRTGILMAFTSSKDCEEHLAEYEVAEHYGIKKVRYVDNVELHSLEPSLSQLVTEGIYCEDQYFIDPSSFMTGLEAKCRDLGVQFLTAEKDIDIRNRKNLIVPIVDGKEIDCENIVIAAGAFSGDLLKRVGVKIPIAFGKGYSVDFPGEDRIKNSIYLSEARVAVTPMDSYLRFAGTMEFGGQALKIDNYRAANIVKSSSKYFDVPFENGLKPRMGLRPMTPDGLPVIGKIANFENLFVATGHAMLGITLAPTTGRLISEIILNNENLQAYSSFSPNRFRTH